MAETKPFDVTLMTPRRMARFMANIHIPDDVNGCWLWTNSVGEFSPYGRFEINGNKYLPHRIALIMNSGRDETGMEACHAPIICKHKNCVSPDHLRWGTRSDNINDRKIELNHRLKQIDLQSD